jgi:hypothetical protein
VEQDATADLRHSVLYKEIMGKFDCNKTPIMPLGTEVMIYIASDVRNTFTPHCNKAFVTGMAPHHYRLLDVCVPATHGNRIFESYRLDPAYWTVPMMSEADNMVPAMTGL